jgi:hypothetical protein|tara:strand:- start:55 stop:474 length:420 start_codon:yes stop_codon:yes gene_type:complete
MSEYIRIWKGIKHLIKGSKEDRFVCNKCSQEFNQQHFQIASAFVDKKTQVIYKRLKKYCKDCENPMRAIRHALEKNPKTPPKPNYCEHCFKKCKPVLHHNHKTGKFVRWACVNCNSRFTKDTFEEYLEEGRRWYNVKVH